MKKSTALFAFLILFMFIGAAQAASLVDGDASKGKAKSAVCAGCHGADGNSMVDQFPKLAGQNAKYIYAQLKHFKSGERKSAIMQPQAAALDDQAMKDLAVYFESQDIKPEKVSDTELAQQGAKIFRGGDPEHDVPACSGCHEAAGRGNPGAGYPHISGQHASYIADELHKYRSLERGDYETSEIMQQVTRGLSDQQIKALSVYIAALAPTDSDHKNTAGALFLEPDEDE